MSDPQINGVETIKVIHADGTEGTTKLRVIGIVKQPAPIVLEPAPAEPSASSQEG
jgi:hypothetical protein